MQKVFQPYHLVRVSPWPLLAGLNSLRFMVSIVGLFSGVVERGVVLPFLVISVVVGL